MNKSPKEIADSLSSEEREKYLLSIQSEDTKMLLIAQSKRSHIDDVLYQKEKAEKLAPYKAQCLKEDGSIDLNVRPITKKEADDYLEFRRKRGEWIEETRTAYLMKKYDEGKLDKRLLEHIETPRVIPGPILKEKSEKAFLRGSTLLAVKEKFKEIMASIFKPTHAEIVAEEMRRRNGK